MPRLECGKCKAVYRDVVRVGKCPLCGNRSFSDAELGFWLKRIFPKWFKYQGNLGYVNHYSMRMDREGIIRARD